MRFILCTLLCMPFIAHANYAADICFDAVNARSDGEVMAAGELSHYNLVVTSDSGEQSIRVESNDARPCHRFSGEPGSYLVYVFAVDSEGRIGESSEIVQFAIPREKAAPSAPNRLEVLIARLIAALEELTVYLKAKS